MAHTKESLETMSARELDAVVCKTVFGYSATNRELYGINSVTPCYSTSLDAAALLTIEIRTRGLVDDYIRIISDGKPKRGRLAWLELSARTRTIAAILAVLAVGG